MAMVIVGHTLIHTHTGGIIDVNAQSGVNESNDNSNNKW